MFIYIGPYGLMCHSRNTVAYHWLADKFDCGWIFSTLSLIHFHRKPNNFHSVHSTQKHNMQTDHAPIYIYTLIIM